MFFGKRYQPSRNVNIKQKKGTIKKIERLEGSTIPFLKGISVVLSLGKNETRGILILKGHKGVAAFQLNFRV